MEKLASIFKSLASIFGSLKRDKRIVEEIAEKKDIKNKVLAVDAELKIIRKKGKIAKKERKQKRKKDRFDRKN